MSGRLANGIVPEALKRANLRETSLISKLSRMGFFRPRYGRAMVQILSLGIGRT
jgi:hypothetical protein